MHDTSNNRCPHAGFHTGRARYCDTKRRLRYVVVCDDCHAELHQLGEIAYTPVFSPDGQADRAA